MAVKELDNAQWEAFSRNDYAVIDCYGENCVACVMLAPVYDGVADELPGIEFGRINISFQQEIGEKFQIDAMPTVLFFRKGSLVDKVIGSVEREELLAHISGLLYQ